MERRHEGRVLEGRDDLTKKARGPLPAGRAPAGITTEVRNDGSVENLENVQALEGRNQRLLRHLDT